MKTSFTFNGQTLPEWAYFITESMPIRPQAKENFVDIPLKNGSIDFNDVNGIYYQDDVITLSISVKGTGFGDTYSKLKILSEWLKGKGDLSFSEIPDKVFKDCKCYSGIGAKFDVAGRKADISVSFRVPASELL